MLLTYKGAEVELPGASQESSEPRQELAEEGGGEACRRIGAVAGEIGEAGVETGLTLILTLKYSKYSSHWNLQGWFWWERRR